MIHEADGSGTIHGLGAPAHHRRQESLRCRYPRYRQERATRVGGNRTGPVPLATCTPGRLTHTSQATV